MSIIKRIFLFIYILVSILYLLIVGIILPRKSKVTNSLISSFPKQPIFFYLGFYILSTLILDYIFKFSDKQAIGLNLLLFAIGKALGMKSRLIGLTGQICSGKRNIINYLRRSQNAYVITNEDIINFIYSQKTLIKEISNLTNENFINEENNGINELVFYKLIIKNPKIIKLFGLKTKIKLYIYIFKIIFIEKLCHFRKLVFLECDLLLKFNFLRIICFPILSVYNSNRDVSINRIMNKYNVDNKKASQIYFEQISYYELNLKSDSVIDNNGTIDDLIRKLNIFISSVI